MMRPQAAVQKRRRTDNMRVYKFFSRQKHEEGIKVFLPFQTAPTRQNLSFLRVATPQLSARLRLLTATASLRRLLVKRRNLDSELEGIKLTASAIKSWSLEEPFTQEAAVELLSNAPLPARQAGRSDG
ncbi:MAG: hypothetical protein IPP74_13040 [Alphaproteobacteria bacterium]|nr:hypothetical protein [Alphaproteobacteria bacterium]